MTERNQFMNNAEEGIPEVEAQLKCKHMRLGSAVIKMPQPEGAKPNDPVHQHTGTVCKDCNEVLHYFQSYCDICGPLP
jgi:hypothetical protein